MNRVLTIKKIEGRPGKVYYPLQLLDRPKPTPGPGEVLVRVHAISLNHRDLFMRRGLYPGIAFDAPLFSDAYATVESLGPNCVHAADFAPGTGVLVTPSRGWASSPTGPENPRDFAVTGGAQRYPEAGTGQTFLVVPETELEISPAHLSPAEAAAVPLVGLTAWRALVTKSLAAQKDHNVLITGIGGGVALFSLQLAVAFGCRVYVTSSDETKIARAKELGAVGGVSYKSATWDKDLRALLPPSRPYLDAVIDGAGGDVVARTVKLLKVGGVISQYGMTVGPTMDWSMGAVLANIELRGSTMGSRAEFAAMVDFVREKRLRPVVSRVVGGGLENLEGLEELFREMDAGKQFGKLVLEIGKSEDGSKL